MPANISFLSAQVIFIQRNMVALVAIMPPRKAVAWCGEAQVCGPCLSENGQFSFVQLSVLHSTICSFCIFVHCRSHWAGPIYWHRACPHCACLSASASLRKLLPIYYSLPFCASQVRICWLHGLSTCEQHFACPSIVNKEHADPAATEHLFFFPHWVSLSSLGKPRRSLRVVPQASVLRS